MKQVFLKLRWKLSVCAPMVVMLLCISQPILDAISFWQAELSLLHSLSFLPRAILLIGAGLFGFLISDRKWIYALAAVLLSAFWGAHMLVSSANGYLSPIEDLSNFIRVLALPVFTLALISCIRANEAAFTALKKGLALSLLITVSFALLAMATGTEPFTYPDKQEGIRGWCIWPNTQSAIVSTVVPILVLYVHEKKKNAVWTVTAFALGLVCLFFLGTRLSFAAMTAIGLFFSVCVLLFRTEFPKKRLGAFFLAITLALTALLPVSPMYRNQAKVQDNVPIREAIFDNLLEQGEALAVQEGLDGSAYEKRRLEPVYTYYLTDFVDVFGLDEALEVYDYRDDYSIIPGLREYKLKFCKQLMKHSVPATKLFGLEISRMFVGHGFDVENDFHAVWYLFGWVGLAALALFLCYFLLRVIRALLRMKKAFQFFPALCFGVSLGMCLVHAYCTCGVLRRSNALFYMAAILAGIHKLTDIKSEMRP